MRFLLHPPELLSFINIVPEFYIIIDGNEIFTVKYQLKMKCCYLKSLDLH